MRALGFLVSLLVHLLLLLLLIQVRIPMIGIPVRTQVIQIVPMSPPPAVEPPAPLPVYVRPFVLKGGAPGPARAGSSAKSGAAGSALPRAVVPPRRVPGPPGQPSVPAGGMSAAAAVTTAPAPPAEHSPRLTVDLDRVARKLKEKNASDRSAGGTGFPAGPVDAGLPFDAAPLGGNAPAGGEGGDGTASMALAGNAFFDSRGYDITPWAKRMVYRVKKNWIYPPASLYGLKGTVGIYVLIERDGAVSRVFIRKTSNIRPFDQAAFNAIELSAPLPPLPDDFPHENLPAYLLFYYN
ncbi:MAG TPA: TonB family protein [Acidobacteriota bacterium]